MLFHGPPGTGKTTTAHAIAKKLYPSSTNASLLELNASDDRGIDVIREQVKRFSSTRLIFGKGHKLIILDESDAMTSAAQAALRRIMEQYTSNVRFILICNYPEKLIPALRSRCTEFRFPPLPKHDAEVFLRRICESEKLEISQEGINALLDLGIGDLRRSINLLQTTSMSSKQISDTSVYRCAGYPLPSEIEQQLNTLMTASLDQSVASLQSLIDDRGLSLLDVIREIHSQFVLLELSPLPMANLLDNLAQIEKRIAEGACESVQAAAIAAAFQVLRSEVE